MLVEDTSPVQNEHNKNNDNKGGDYSADNRPFQILAAHPAAHSASRRAKLLRLKRDHNTVQSIPFRYRIFVSGPTK